MFAIRSLRPSLGEAAVAGAGVRTRVLAPVAVATSALLVLSGCGAQSEQADAGQGSAAASSSVVSQDAEQVTVLNCGEEVTFPKATHMFVNDSNIISIALAAGAKDDIAAVSSLKGDSILAAVYSADVIGSLNDVSDEYPSFEQIIAESPDVYFAGYGYGLNEGKGITPETLAEHGIATYQLTEACRQGEGNARGTTDPWEAVYTDIANIGAITGHEATANAEVAQMRERLEALRKAPKGEKTPVGFLFDSGSDTVFTSGCFGAPEAIMNAAGSANATSEIADTWVTVSWEKIADAQPDFFVFVDYPGQTFAEKVEQLKQNPVTKNLDAVVNNRFINLPYAMWTSGPLNIDAAELLRKGLEYQQLLPASEVIARITLPAEVPGQEYFVAK